MVGTDSVFAGSIPEIYDTYLVPLIFESYARDMARRVADAAPRAVLETAAGSGVVTRALAPRLAPDARYTVTDLNPAMLARARAVQPEPSRMDWQPADALALPFEDESFDIVCCQFGVMFFPDKVAGLAEARRVLKPGGRLIFNVWDRIEENHFADLVTRAAGEIFPDDPPVFLARTPHGYHDSALIRANVEAAGFAEVALDTVTETARADTAKAPAVAYCQGTPLRNEIEARDENLLEEVTNHAAEAIRSRYGPGPVEAPIRGHVIVAVR